MKSNQILQKRNDKLTLILFGACYLLSVMQAHASPNHLQGYVLDVQLTPAVCSLDQATHKLRRCLEGYSLTINGLLPEINRKDCKTASSPYLPPLQAKVVARVMPEENTRNRLWYSIGGCVPMNASQYFRNMINKADQLKIPLDLTEAENKKVQRHALINQFLRLNPKLSHESLRLTCSGKGNKSILTGLKICYKVNGQYKSCPSTIQTNCPTIFSIKGSY
ncbi:ribonuclease T2 family protein [Acinetobacter shaoyimingii]|uniref:Ribonuclease I n=1 Tax=Acinetobacter shaoyimingii TaxID=2715164 RepID=A0A6G8S0A3_9GAMM|nr:ribonuclease I [Acinetobacter shaoyimingii]QIO07544.1 ribonuclease I [Acinetobacter shaoyimingii]